MHRNSSLHKRKETTWWNHCRANNWRNIANVRIHVECVIGNIRKKYSLLSGTQPIELVSSSDENITTLDKIVYVCYVIINMCDSVVPFDWLLKHYLTKSFNITNVTVHVIIPNHLYMYTNMADRKITYLKICHCNGSIGRWKS